MAPILLALLLAPAPDVVPDRLDLSDRLRRLDAAWIETREEERRERAIPSVTAAVASFFSGRFGLASQALDRAVAELEAREVSPLDATRLSLDPPAGPPGKPVRLRVDWLYTLESNEPISVKVGERVESVVPGYGAWITLPAPESEGHVEFALRHGRSERRVAYDAVERLNERLASLERTEGASREAALVVRGALTERFETRIPILDWIRTAEAIAEGGLSAVEHVPAALRDGIPLRAFVPRAARDGTPVVVALHGAGGSENMFFDAYGNGLAVRLAQARGWIFLSPRSTPTAAGTALAWLREDRGLSPGPVFVIGHSMGGGHALASAQRPAALALFAPAAGALPAGLKDVPIFLAVGQQELPMLRSGAERLAASLGPQGEFRQYPRSEHLMIVADALPDAYRFFDALAALANR
jgi:pimeloyl-ACP methyl ester carboxylesterase